MNPRAKSTGTAVAVPRGVLVALVVALLAGVLALAFLAGRESARSGQPAPASVGGDPAAPAVLAASPTNTSPSDGVTVPLPAFESGPTAAPQAVAGETSLAGAPPSASPRDALRDDVARYFHEVETIESRAKSWNDPQILARTLLEQGVKGDASGFDALVAANQKARDAIGAVAVPEPCREHHGLTLALLDQSVAMLRRVMGQLGGRDAGSLAALPAEGLELERKAKDVDALAREIKRSFGL